MWFRESVSLIVEVVVRKLCHPNIAQSRKFLHFHKGHHKLFLHYSYLPGTNESIWSPVLHFCNPKPPKELHSHRLSWSTICCAFTSSSPSNLAPAIDWKKSSATLRSVNKTRPYEWYEKTSYLDVMMESQWLCLNSRKQHRSDSGPYRHVYRACTKFLMISPSLGWASPLSVVPAIHLDTTSLTMTGLEHSAAMRRAFWICFFSVPEA